MADYLLDTNIILRAIQPQTPTHLLAVAAVTTILEKDDNCTSLDGNGYYQPQPFGLWLG